MSNIFNSFAPVLGKAFKSCSPVTVQTQCQRTVFNISRAPARNSTGPRTAADRLSQRIAPGGGSAASQFEARNKKDLAEKNAREDRARALEKRILRKWAPGDVFAPKDLSSYEMSNYIRRPPPSRDAFDYLGIDPLVQYKNISILTEYVTKMGKIKHRNTTGLRPVNQRKIAKAVRRAISIGLIPSTYRHPMILERELRNIIEGGSGHF